MTTIDRYIRRATLGLPRHQRVDTAAELRVHLNERARALADEGFALEEAEHLVVEHMGPVEDVNRRFLGHAFTVRAGWVVAVLLLFGLLAWFAVHFVFVPGVLARPHALTLEDVLPLIGDFAAVDVTVPATARATVIGVSRGGKALFTSASPLTEPWVAPPNEAGSLGTGLPSGRPSRTLVVGFPAAGGLAAACAPGSYPFLVTRSDARGSDGVLRAHAGSSRTCMPMPGAASGGIWHDLTDGGVPVRFDAWLPLLAFEPFDRSAALTSRERGRAVEAASDAGGAGPAAPSVQRPPADGGDWIVVSVYTSEAPVDDLHALPAPPTGVAIANAF